MFIGDGREASQRRTLRVPVVALLAGVMSFTAVGAASARTGVVLNIKATPASGSPTTTFNIQGTVASAGRTPSGTVTFFVDGVSAGTVTLDPASAVLPNGVVQVGAGDGFTCVLTSAGAVLCWGDNSYGQLGRGASVGAPLVPSVVLGLSSGVKAIAVGQYHVCALTTDGAVKCWGYGGNGVIGDNTGTSRDAPSSVIGLFAGVEAITAGSSISCALTASKGVKCWGASPGDGNGVSYVPVDVTGLTTGVASIASGTDHTCAVLETGAVKCWGGNSFGEVGDGTSNPRYAPVSVSGLSGIASVIPGYSRTCAVTEAGAVKCWGANSNGELGDGTITPSRTPVNVIGISWTVAGLRADELSRTCALTGYGETRCWGRGPASEFWAPPVAFPAGLDTSVQIEQSSYHACALTILDGVKCWGTNSYGELGGGNTDPSPTVPVKVAGLASGASRQTVSKALTGLTPGSHVVRAVYSGDTGFLGTKSNDITVRVANTPPNFAQNPLKIDTNEDTPSGARLMQVADADGDALTFTVTRQPGKGSVQLFAGVRKFSYTPNPNVSGTDSFGIRATDTHNGSATLTVSVTIHPVDDAATNISVSAAASIPENTPGAVAARYTISDIDSFAGTLTVSNTHFVAAGGLVRLKTGEKLDRELTASVPLTVTLRDHSTILRRSFTVPVADDIHDYDVSAPVDADPTANEIKGSAPIGTSTGIDAQAEDKDATKNRVTYVLIGSSEFAINTITGAVRTRRIFNPGTALRRTIIVEARSEDGSSARTAFPLKILPLGIVFVGGDEPNHVTGSGWPDDLSGNGGNDILLGNGGTDKLNGGADDDTLSGGPGRDDIDGGPGNDTADYSEKTAAVTVLLGTTPAPAGAPAPEDTLQRVENVIGGKGNDFLIGNTDINILEGGPGNDTLDGGPDSASVVDYASYEHAGGPISLDFHLGQVKDLVAGKTFVGTDRFVTRTGEFPFTIEGVLGSRFNDLLVGRGLNRARLEGGPGNDRLIGDSNPLIKQRAVFRTAKHAVIVNLDAGFSDNRDPAENSEGRDTLININMVSGTRFSDELIGNGVKNVFNGGLGGDKITGGGGPDEFNYLVADDSPPGDPDEITDFSGLQNDYLDIASLKVRRANWTTAPFGTNPAKAARFVSGQLQIDLDSDPAPEMIIKLTGVRTFSPNYIRFDGDPPRD